MRTATDLTQEEKDALRVALIKMIDFFVDRDVAPEHILAATLGAMMRLTEDCMGIDNARILFQLATDSFGTLPEDAHVSQTRN